MPQQQQPFQLARYALEAWKLTYKHKSSFMGATLFYAVLIIVLIAIFSDILKNTGLVFGSSSQPFGLQDAILYLLIFGFLTMLIPISGGYLQSAHSATTEGSIPSNDYFAGYRKPKWGNLVITGLLLIIIYYFLKTTFMLLIASTFESSLQDSMLNIDDAPSYLEGIDAAIDFILLLFQPIYFWSMNVAYFFDKSGWSALNMSRRLIGWRFLWITLCHGLLFVALILVFYLIALSLSLSQYLLYFIIICSSLALLFFVPYYYNFMYVSFADTVGLNEVEVDSNPDHGQIIDHFMPE